MRTMRTGGKDVIVAGGLTDAVIDTLYDAQYGNPAIVPAPIFSGPTYNAGGLAQSAAFDYSVGLFNPWGNGDVNHRGSKIAFGASGQIAPSQATFSYTGVACKLTFDCYNDTAKVGGITFLTLDNAPVLPVDTYGTDLTTVSTTLLTPEGGFHTVGISFGYWVNAAALQAGLSTAPTNTVGTSVLQNITLTKLPGAYQPGGTYVFTASASNQITVTGSNIPYAGPYNLGTSDIVSAVPGYRLDLGGTAMTVNDQATISVTGICLSINSALVATSEATDAVYTTPVITAGGQYVTWSGNQPSFVDLPLKEQDLALQEGQIVGETPIQWLCASWEEDPNHPITTATALTGNSLTPTDASWSSCPAGYPNGLGIAHSSDGMGFLGLGVLPYGSYCQLQLSIPTNGFLRNLRLYAWDPENDHDAKLFLPVPDNDLATRFYGALAVQAAITHRDPWREALTSITPGSAVGQGLDLWGMEWKIVRPYGAPDSQFSQLLGFLTQSRRTGATLGFCQHALEIVLGPSAQFQVSEQIGTSSSWTLGTSSLGVDTILGIQNINTLQATVTIPVKPLNVPPQTVQQLLETFRPVCVTINYIWD